MFLICVVYFLQYMNKMAISYASVTGIVENTDMHGNRFDWVIGIGFWVYLA